MDLLASGETQTLVVEIAVVFLIEFILAKIKSLVRQGDIIFKG